jgi:hypothetical protein
MGGAPADALAQPAKAADPPGAERL